MMHIFRIPAELLSICLLLSSSAAATPTDDSSIESVLRRALADSPKAYTPSYVQCPETRPAVRAPSKLSDIESQWLLKRRANTVQPMKDFFNRLKISGFDSDSYLDQGAKDFSKLPNIGIAFSGGGYRALTNGAGAFAAFDSRTPGSTRDGHIGGLLQSSTYVSGLSGGGWLVGSLFGNNFSSVDQILESNARGSNVWALDRSIIEGPKTESGGLLSATSYWKSLYDQINGKRDAGFDSSITDIWGRGLSYQWFNTTDGGAAYTFSSFANSASLSDGKTPLPILLAVVRSPGEKIIPINSTNFEFNPWESGSWDPSLYGFAPTKYMGSTFEGGTIGNSQQCVVGFDNAGFVMGTSSSLFNIAVMLVAGQPSSSGLIGTLVSWVQDLAKKFGDAENDIASWSPNPFFKWNSQPVSADHNLTLVDGGESGENIPLAPHLQRQRNVDVVFAVDASADTGNGKGWPNGTSLIATYERSKNSAVMNGTAFPAIPDINTFINLGLNARPTFFGCDSKNQSAPTPLVVYIPNHPYSFWSNITTYTVSMNTTTRNSIIRNGYEAATMGNGTIESDWPVCVGCAILSRSLERTGTPVPKQCSDCFQRHCWNGTRNSREATFDPPMGGSAAKSPGTVGVTAGKKNAAPRTLAANTMWTAAVLAVGVAFLA